MSFDPAAVRRNMDYFSAKLHAEKQRNDVLKPWTAPVRTISCCLIRAVGDRLPQGIFPAHGACRRKIWRK